MDRPVDASAADWRRIVALGRNTASYKFSLAQTLLELGQQEREFLALEDLALPFAKRVAAHLKSARQGVMATSKFLSACAYFNEGRVSEDTLRDAALELGFRNVIDAFHVVDDADTDTRFFIDERRGGGLPGIRLTDDALRLATEPEVARCLDREAEGRWNLVEQAWETRHSTGQLLIVQYDPPEEILVEALSGKRRPITVARWALNSYQRGRCFYCYEQITVFPGSDTTADVDHVFPHRLMASGFPFYLDSPWNLVLACQNCNRGAGGKFGALQSRDYLERLARRNEAFIASHHLLGETLTSLRDHRHPSGATSSKP